MKHSKPVRLKTACTQVRGESVYLFLEFTIVLVCEIVGVYIMLEAGISIEKRGTVKDRKERLRFNKPEAELKKPTTELKRLKKG